MKYCARQYILLYFLYPLFLPFLNFFFINHLSISYPFSLKICQIFPFRVTRFFFWFFFKNLNDLTPFLCCPLLILSLSCLSLTFCIKKKTNNKNGETHNNTTNIFTNFTWSSVEKNISPYWWSDSTDRRFNLSGMFIFYTSPFIDFHSCVFLNVSFTCRMTCDLNNHTSCVCLTECSLLLFLMHGTLSSNMSILMFWL